MFPGERRRMGKQSVRHGFALVAQVLHGLSQVGTVLHVSAGERSLAILV